MSNPNENPQEPYDISAQLGYDPNAVYGEIPEGAPVDFDADPAQEAQQVVPPKPTVAPTVGASEANDTQELPQKGRVRRALRTRTGKTAAGLLLAGVTASGVGMLVSSDGHNKIDDAASYVMEHRNNMTPQERAEYGIPSATARTEITVGSVFEEVGEGALAVDAALISVWGVGNRLKALGAWRKHRSEEKANNPKMPRSERRKQRKLENARKLVEAADAEEKAKEGSSESKKDSSES